MHKQETSEQKDNFTNQVKTFFSKRLGKNILRKKKTKRESLRDFQSYSNSTGEQLSPDKFDQSNSQIYLKSENSMSHSDYLPQNLDQKNQYPRQSVTPLQNLLQLNEPIQQNNFSPNDKKINLIEIKQKEVQSYGNSQIETRKNNIELIPNLDLINEVDYDQNQRESTGGDMLIPIKRRKIM
ncbi:UNKNOWN [Stylonychia lemnae]|uniref:Uncharacterized protein n=1 Tax=Stylonychia lemnae TaxID=5949 RepID=A0A078A260_STYLE|nr:UNKNOWN [Stylonychia lemnae]|eukprot:CDW76225.1 UNKNOWN [Stylonychia lemnae]